MNASEEIGKVLEIQAFDNEEVRWKIHWKETKGRDE